MSTVTLIVSISVIVLLIYIIYSIMRRDTYSGSILSANKETTVVLNTDNTSSAAAYSIWIYVSEWSIGPKNIFSRGNFLSVGLDNTKNSLVVSVPSIINSQYKKYPYNYATPGASPTYYYGTNDTCELLCTNSETCYGFNYYDVIENVGTTGVIENRNNQTNFNNKKGCILVDTEFTPNDLNSTTNNVYTELKNKKNDYVINSYIPLQEWVCITINMDAQYTEVYINGKMVQTIINTNGKHSGDVILSKGNGFIGSNSKFQNFDKTLTPQEIWNNYKGGFGYYSSLSDYSVKVRFYKADV